MSSALRVLLVNPWIADFAAYDLWAKPLGLMIVAGKLRNAGADIYLLDLLDRNHPRMKALEKHNMRKADGRGKYYKTVIQRPEILADIPRQFGYYGWTEEVASEEVKRLPVPEVIFVTSMMIYWYPGVMHTIEFLRNAFPDVKIILGGNYATLMPEHARKYSGADEIVIGYGETQILNLLHSSGWTLKAEANQEPWSGQYKLPWELYPELDSVPVLTSRGCPYRCSFCATKLLNPGFIQRHPDNVVEELQWIANDLKVLNVAFYDDALFINRDKHIIPILREVARKDLNLNFHTPNGLFPAQINQELAELMKSVNLRTVRLSFETSAGHLQEKLSGKVNRKAFEKGVENLIRVGYKSTEIEVYLLMGLPGQKPENVEKDLKYIHDLGLISRLASFSPIPGTEDYEQVIQNGLIRKNPDPLILNNSVFPYFNRDFPYKVVQNLRERAIQYNQSLRS